MKRRKFIKNTAAATGGLVVSPYLATKGGSFKYSSPNDKIHFGVIGCNGMGWSNLVSHLQMPDVDCLAICDVDQSVLSRRARQYAQFRNHSPEEFRDYRKMLENDRIDAVIIGTPDHWHCRMMVDALDAGKHVYVEKPVALTMEESMIMMKAAERTDKMIQVGQWQRSGIHYQKAIKIVRSGILGKIRLVKTWAYQGWMEPIPVREDTIPPESIDYDMWLGPAPKRPFNPNRFHFNFRWFWDYAGGLMTDWGVHEIDIALYAMEAIDPVSVVASGGKFAYPHDASETPDTLQAIFEFTDFNMLWEHATGIDLGPYGKREGIAFIGNNGTLILNREGYEIIREREPDGYSNWGEFKMEEIESMSVPEGVNYLHLHTANFVDAIKNHDSSLLNTPIRSGSVAALNAQMGNIAYRLGRKIHWDAKTKSFKNDQEANEMMKARYFNGWEVPKSY